MLLYYNVQDASGNKMRYSRLVNVKSRYDNREALHDGKKICYLTFDDGPSLTNTPNVIKILNENNVKGTFFVIGKSLKIDGAPVLSPKQALKAQVAQANYDTLTGKVNALVNYLNELAQLEHTEAIKNLELKYNGDLSTAPANFEKAHADAVANYGVALNTTDYQKLISSLNYQFDQTDAQGLGEPNTKLIKKGFKWSCNSAKLNYKHALLNIKAHRAIAGCQGSLEQVKVDTYAQKAEALKHQVAKITNERIKPNIINYLDGLTYSQAQWAAQHEGGNE